MSPLGIAPSTIWVWALFRNWIAWQKLSTIWFSSFDASDCTDPLGLSNADDPDTAEPPTESRKVARALATSVVRLGNPEDPAMAPPSRDRKNARNAELESK